MSAVLTAGGPATLDDLLASRRIATLDADTLKNVRAIADTWRTASILGAVLAAGAAYVTGASSIQNLSAAAITELKWTASAAAVFALFSILLAMLAAFGWPTSLTINSPSDLLTWEKKTAKTAKYELAFSLVAALLSILAIAASVAIVVFGPTNSPGVMVTLRTGNPVCYVSVEQDGNNLVGVDSANAKQPIDPTNVAKITAVVNC
jgi:hypothetical protein